ncbi:MAG: excinuclease ABC subunit UvrA [Pirellulales bacterium]
MAASHQQNGNGSADEFIRIRGARVHNLRNVDLDIPRDQLVVITGPSGSGKSTLAMDTLCAEGQRQYIESLSTYARQFLHQMERPDVDLIEGLPPTIAVDQRASNPNPRSTLATVTEIYDHLRLLMARLGQPYCYQCGESIEQQTVEQILDTLFQLPEKTKAMILAPYVRGRRGGHRDVFAKIRKSGFVRARIDGEVFDIEQVPDLEPRKVHHIEAVVDRVIIRDGVRSRIAESIDLAVKHGGDTVIVCYLEGNGRRGRWQDLVLSTQYACTNCHISYQELEPRTFSFNSPYGACPTCDGLGRRVEFDPELIVRDMSLSLADGAVVPWKGAKGPALGKIRRQLEPFLAPRKFDWQTPLAQLSPTIFDRFLRGDGKKFIGLLNMLEKEFATTSSESRQQRLASFRAEVECPDCGGSRLRPEARSVRIGGRSIQEINAMPVKVAVDFFRDMQCDAEDQPVFEPIVREVERRLGFLEKVGVGYLSLDRAADSLSGGELQRVRLATGIGAGLAGVCYILDEPSVGLHPRDNRRLIDAVRDLQSQGSTVLVVEHDEAIIRNSDYLIDMGPGAGQHGGLVVAQGTPDSIRNNADSITGQYLAHKKQIVVPNRRRRTVKSRSIELLGACTNNLKKVDVRFPLGALVCVTGVSGSGKSSLVNETLARVLRRRLGGGGPKPGEHTGLRGASQINRLVEVDQSPIGRTPRSNPATYTGMFDEIRKAYAGTREARRRGFGAGRFSFNVKGGRCEACQGQGQKKIDMKFLPDLYVTCSECGGTRFNRQTLEVRYRDLSIADVLDLQVEEALRIFENFPLVDRTLRCLFDVGLGYVKLGQSSMTLSGGEAQRVKLATELARADDGGVFYILDEPTTGLHFDDIRKLLEVLAQLVDHGNTMLVIEHNLDVIKSADWIIDLGPEGGEHGGQITATGTPEQIASLEGNHTGRFLAPLLTFA